MLAEIWKHLHTYNCVSDVCFCACSPPLAPVLFVQWITNTNTDNEISDPACRADVRFGRHLGKMNRFSCSCCFTQTGHRRGESNYKDLSLEVAWVALTGTLLRESCKDTIFWLIAIGVIPGDGVYGLNVCSADGALWAGGRTGLCSWLQNGFCLGHVKVTLSLRHCPAWGYILERGQQLLAPVYLGVTKSPSRSTTYLGI